MGGAKTSAGLNRRRSRLRRFAHRAGYLIVLLVLIGWEVQEGKVYQSEKCDLRTATPSESMLMKPAYDWVLKVAQLKNSEQVAEVGIEDTLQQIPDNVCVARAFTADLLKVIAAQGPRVIALDKFYGATSCADNDPGTVELLKTIRSLNVPVVVGSATQDSKQMNTTSCLVLSTELFTPFQNDAPKPGFSMAGAWLSADESRVVAAPGAASTQIADSGSKEVVVYTGLTRLSEDPLKIPVMWPVYPDAAATQSNKYTTGPLGYSFALTTAQLVNPKIVSDKTLLNSNRQPYANVSDPLPHEGTKRLLCSVGAGEVAQRWRITCPKEPKPGLNLKDKVVVIGSRSSNDDRDVPGGKMYGYDLQAHYVAALLSGAYLQDFSPWWILAALLIFYGIAEGLLPHLSVREHPVLGLPHIGSPWMWDCGIFILAVLAGFFLPLWRHRFPPLGVLLVVMAIFVPRFLIEMWTLFNERMDEAEKEKERSS